MINNDTTANEILENDDKLNDQDLIDLVSADLIKLLKEKPLDIYFNQKESGSESDNNSTKKSTYDAINFKLNPKDIVQHLDDYVISQDEAKKTLAIAICDHMNMIKQCMNNPHQDYSKQNVLMLGPSGVGKTFLIKCIADLIGIPFIKSDATKFTETGYQGSDVEDLVRQLIKKDKDLAKYGIIYLDEVDKIAGSASTKHKDVGGRGVQANLLKLLEETDVPVRAAWDMQSQMKAMMGGQSNEEETISTKHILFILSGAFVGLEDLIQKREQGSKFGFDREYDGKSTQTPSLHRVKTDDLVKYGFETEFIGRLPVRVCCDPLTKDDLIHILKDSKSSYLKQCTVAFEGYGIEAFVVPETFEIIADEAIKEETGARALMTVIEKTVRDFKYELPSSDCKYLLITPDMIHNPQPYLQSLLKDPEKAKKKFMDTYFSAFESILSERIQFPIKLNKAAREFWIEQHQTMNLPLRELHKEFMHRFLQVQDHIPRDKAQFTITKTHATWSNDDWKKWVYRQEDES